MPLVVVEETIQCIRYDHGTKPLKCGQRVGDVVLVLIEILPQLLLRAGAIEKNYTQIRIVMEQNPTNIIKTVGNQYESGFKADGISPECGASISRRS